MRRFYWEHTTYLHVKENQKYIPIKGLLHYIFTFSRNSPDKQIFLRKIDCWKPHQTIPIPAVIIEIESLCKLDFKPRPFFLFYSFTRIIKFFISVIIPKLMQNIWIFFIKWCNLFHSIYFRKKIIKLYKNGDFSSNFNNLNNSNDVIWVFAYFQLIKI